MEFNFVSTTYRNLKKELEKELKLHLSDFEPITFFETQLNSVVYGRLSGDPVLASKKLWRIAYEDPWSVKRILRFIPITHNCSSELEEIAKVASEASQKLPGNLTYKIEAEIRLSKIRWGELIKKVTSSLSLKPNVKNPDVYLYIEVVGSRCGLSFLKKDEVFRALEAKLAGSYFP